MTAFGRPSKKTYRILLAAACLAGAPAFMPESAAQLAAAALFRDPLSIFADRSPGARATGALTQSKLALASHRTPRRAASLPGGVERGDGALPAPTTGSPIFGFAPSGMPLLPANDLPLATTAGGAPFEDFPGGGTSGGGFLPPGGGGTGGVGGGGGGGGYYDIPPTVPGGGGGTPPGSVPEPATWLTTILGLAAVGTMLRRRRANGSALLRRHATR